MLKIAFRYFKGITSLKALLCILFPVPFPCMYRIFLGKRYKRLRDRHVFKDPQTESAKNAKATCEKYVWNKKGTRVMGNG